MRKDHLFLAFEGLSSVGKSTLAEETASRLGAALFRTPPEPFASLRDQIDREATLAERYYFYLASVYAASAEIKEALGHSSVVCDRYLLTTECWHRVRGIETLGGYETMPPAILVPDLTVLVTCPNEIRVARLYARGLSPNDYTEEMLRIADRFLAEYRRHEVTEIDNGGRIDETLETLFFVLRSQKLWQD